MTILLSDLVDRLQVSEAPAGDAPSYAQYMRAVQDAVIDFNDRATRLKTALIAVHAGTATYALPADFVKFVALSDLAAVLSYPNVIIAPAGLIPVSASFDEVITIEGGQLLISPTPLYTLDRLLTYGAGLVLSTDANHHAGYAAMAEREARIVLLGARAAVLELKLIGTTGSIKTQTMGEVSVTLADATSDLTARRNAARAQYEDAVKTYVGTILKQRPDDQLDRLRY